MLLFLSEEHVFTFFDAVQSIQELSQVTWILADYAPFYFGTPYMAQLNGAIYIDHMANEVPHLQSSIKKISPWTDPDNPWLQELWENVHKCNLSDSLNTTGHACVASGFLDDFVCPSLPRFTSRVYDAVNAFAIALHRLIDDNCMTGFIDKSILTKCISGPLLLKYLYNSSFDGVTGKVHFNPDGSSVESFVMRQFQRNDLSYVGAAFGSWNATTSTISVDVEKLIWVSKTSGWSSIRTSEAPSSVCSLPCQEDEYIIEGAVSCCWTCVPCRDDEIVNSNTSGCESCPLFQWPDGTKRTCTPIEPTYLHLSHPISVCLLVMSAAGILSSVTVMTTFVIKRRHKLVMATSLPLSMIILSGTLLVAVGIVAFVAPPTSNGVCVTRSFGFHSGISTIYVPLSVKNMRIYRIFSAGASKVSFTSNKMQILFTANLAVIQVTVF